MANCTLCSVQVWPALWLRRLSGLSRPGCSPPGGPIGQLTKMYSVGRLSFAAQCPRLTCATCTDGLYRIGKYEGLPGLYKGTLLGIIGVSNGAIQFMAYEELKKYARERKTRRGMSEADVMDLVRQAFERSSTLPADAPAARAMQSILSYRAQRNSLPYCAPTRTRSSVVGCRYFALLIRICEAF